MAKESKDDDRKQVIIIKRVKKVVGGHHGGAWKVAYADFVTAMMAFFLLLWLLAVTTADAKKKIADYFAPQTISTSETGSGGIMGGTTISEEGSMTNTTQEQVESGNTHAEESQEKKADAETDKQDEKSFKSAEDAIRQAIDSDPEMKELAQNLLIDMTPEGLRIQIVDQEGKPMFQLGSATPMPQAVKLLTLVTKTIKDLPNKISIRGHTDSKPYGKDANYTNWELSSDRSNASRRVMLDAGLDLTRIENVQGKADRELLLPADPASARNRRISIILMKQSLVAGTKRTEEKFKNKKSLGTPAPAPTLKKREEGVIYFP